MFIPSLKALCAREIYKDEATFKESLKENLPAEVLEIIKNESPIGKWKWFVTNLGDKTMQSENEFYLTTKNYKDFSVLCPQYQVTEQEFFLSTKHEDHDLSAISKIVEFVREKGKITGCSVEVNRSIENPQLSVVLHYHIPLSDRAMSVSFFGKSVDIATVNLPYKKVHAIEVRIKSLSKINRFVPSPWSQETYNKVRDFVIYYVNQLAIDNSNKKFLFCCSTIQTDNRLFSAQNAKDEKESKQHLFGEYKGPRSWLLNF